MCWQHLNAGNDVNGNPRRVFVVYTQAGHIFGTWDEGYVGTRVLPDNLRKLPQLATLTIKPAEYRALLKVEGVGAMA